MGPFPPNPEHAPEPELTWPFGQPPRPADHHSADPQYADPQYADPQHRGDYGQSGHPVPYDYAQPTYPPPGQPSGVAYPPQYPYDPRQQAYGYGPPVVQKSRLAAGLLAIFLGGLGVHNFYLGRTGIGVLQLLLTVLSLGFLAPLVWIWVLVEAILILTRSPSFAADAKGVPLRD